jgi:hypothetical protein
MASMEIEPVSLREFATHLGARTGANRRRLAAQRRAREARAVKMHVCARIGSTLAADRANAQAGSPTPGD